MRYKLLLLALAVALLPATLAGAGTLDRLTATADCNAWSSEVTVAFQATNTDVLLVYSMQLADSTGVEIERFDHEQWLTIPTTANAIYSFGAAWLAPLDRTATMTVTADVYDSRGDRFSLTSGDVVVELACTTPDGGTPVAVCRHASRWWLRHVPQWPVTSLTLGGVDYDATALVRLLRSPHRGQVGHRLAHQLAAAKLNLANGATNDISAQVAAADAWLVAHPTPARSRHHEPNRAARREALRLIKELHRWNHGGCPDGSNVLGDDDQDVDKNGVAIDVGDTAMEFTGDLADYTTTETAAEEITNLGTVKAMFR